jgi:hypothetical protein
MTTPATTADWTVEVVARLDEAETALFFDIYRRSFEPLRTRAAARHLLTAEEFAEEMADDRIDKYVARSPDGRAVGLTTLTADLSTVAWISPDYYRARWPEHASDGRLYYLGYTLADASHQRAGVFEAMLDAFADRMVAEDAVMAWDMCAFNVETVGFADAVERMFGDRCPAPAVVDTQRYYAADFGPGRAADGPGAR